MTFLKKIYPFITLLIGIGLGWYFAFFIHDSNSSSRTEEIIGNEIKLLELANLYPIPCAELKKSTDIVITKEQEFVILWKKSTNSSIEKIVIDRNFNSANDNQPNTCNSLTP